MKNAKNRLNSPLKIATMEILPVARQSSGNSGLEEDFVRM